MNPTTNSLGTILCTLTMLVGAWTNLGAQTNETILAIDNARKQGNHEQALRIILTEDPELKNIELLTRASDIISEHGRYIPQTDVFIIGDLETGLTFLLTAHGKSLQTYPRYGALWLSKANVLFRVYQTPSLAPGVLLDIRTRAIEAYEKALQNGVRAPGIRERTGLLIAESGDGPRALLYFQAALAENPSNEALRFNVAFTLQSLGRPQDALGYLLAIDFEKAPPEVSKNAQLLLGEVYIMLTRYPDAISTYQAAYAKDLSNLYPLRRLIFAQLKIGDKNAANGSINTYLEASRSDQDSLTRLYQTLAELQEEALMVPKVREMRLRYARQRPEAAAGLAWFEGSLLLEAQKFQEALAVIRLGRRYLMDVQGYDALDNELQRLELRALDRQ